MPPVPRPAQGNERAHGNGGQGRLRALRRTGATLSPTRGSARRCRIPHCEGLRSSMRRAKVALRALALRHSPGRRPAGRRCAVLPVRIVTPSSGLKAGLGPRRHGMQFAGRFLPPAPFPEGNSEHILRRIADASRSGWHEMAADWPLKTGAACWPSALGFARRCGRAGVRLPRRGGACGYPPTNPSLPPISSHKEGGGRQNARVMKRG